MHYIDDISLIEALPLVIAHGDPVLKESHEIACIESHEERKEREEEVARGVVYEADQPAEEPSVLEEA